MPELDPNLLALLGRVQDRLLENPRCLMIMQEIQEGKYTLEEGVRKLVVAIREEGLSREIQEEASFLTSLLPAKVAEEPRPLVMKTSTGIPQLNPKVEAAIAERAALDGDVPEFRSGPLPEGAEPAVPVETDSLDPVYVGEQLRVASEEVNGLLLCALEDHAVALRKALTEEAERKGGEDEETRIARVQASLPVPTGVPGYEAGKLPVLRTVAPPSALALHSLPTVERQKRAYKAIATTQGRRSLASPIAKRVVALLQAKGVDVQLGHPDPELTSWSWMTRAFGAEDLSDTFPFANVAAEVMAAHFMEALQKGGDGPFVLEVHPRADISMRLFGWTARLGKEPPPC